MRPSSARDPLDLWRTVDDAVWRESAEEDAGATLAATPVKRRLASAPLLAQALARRQPAAPPRQVPVVTALHRTKLPA